MGRRKVGGHKWAASERRGEEGVGITDEGMVSWMRARHHGRGHGVTDEGAESRMRVQCPG